MIRRFFFTRPLPFFKGGKILTEATKLQGSLLENGVQLMKRALAARHGETQKECEGGLQEKLVRDTICAVMEGGRKAFEQRYRRIVLEG